MQIELFRVFSLVLHASKPQINTAMRELLVRMNKSRKQMHLLSHSLSKGTYIRNPKIPKTRFITDRNLSMPLTIVVDVANHQMTQDYYQLKKQMDVYLGKCYSGQMVPLNQFIQIKDYRRLDLSLMEPVMEAFVSGESMSHLEYLLYMNSINFLSSRGCRLRDGFEKFTKNKKSLRWFYQTQRAFLVFFLKASQLYNGKLDIISKHKAVDTISHIEESKQNILHICTLHRDSRTLLAAGFGLVLNLDRIIRKGMVNTCSFFKELPSYFQ